VRNGTRSECAIVAAVCRIKLAAGSACRGPGRSGPRSHAPLQSVLRTPRSCRKGAPWSTPDCASVACRTTAGKAGAVARWVLAVTMCTLRRWNQLGQQAQLGVDSEWPPAHCTRRACMQTPANDRHLRRYHVCWLWVSWRRGYGCQHARCTGRARSGARGRRVICGAGGTRDPPPPGKAAHSGKHEPCSALHASWKRLTLLQPCRIQQATKATRNGQVLKRCAQNAAGGSDASPPLTRAEVQGRTMAPCTHEDAADRSGSTASVGKLVAPGPSSHRLSRAPLDGVCKAARNAD
jgi:hypothetical protein